MTGREPSSLGTEDARVVIVGPGAMGCMYAALLARAGVNVALLDHRPERAALIAEHGVTLITGEGSQNLRTPCQWDPAVLQPPSLLVILVKAYDTARAIGHARSLIGADTSVLTLQNGLGNYQVIAERVGVERTLAGSTTAGATLLQTGVVRMVSAGDVAIGSPVGARPVAERAGEVLARAGCVVRVERDVDALLWRKALVNAAINPLTALTGRRNGELLEDARLRKLLAEVARETYAVGTGLGVAWGGLDPVAAVEDVCRRTAANLSSMLQDVRARRRTEIDSINGYIARCARASGGSAPLNETLAALVGGLAQGAWPPDSGAASAHQPGGQRT